MQNLLHSVGEFLTPTLKKSNFTETGRLTPDEFVAAGDYLVFKCPTWSWSAGDSSRARSFLPPNKQVLVTRNVPSLAGLKRVEERESVSEDGDFFSWVSMVVDKDDEQQEEVGDIDDIGINQKLDEMSLGSGAEEPLTSLPPSNPDEEIPDLEDFQIEDNIVVVNDPSEYIGQHDLSKTKHNDNIMRTRTFDLSITYDKYYQTPRVWVTGYSSTGAPLPPTTLFDSISTEHARKTVTIETHPAFGIPMASIHPCKHAHVMKRIVGFMGEERGAGGGVRVDQYLVVFLKFISTVLPHIDYDHTMSLDA